MFIPPSSLNSSMTLLSNSPMNPVSGLKGYSFPFPKPLMISSDPNLICNCLCLQMLDYNVPGGDEPLSLCVSSVSSILILWFWHLLVSFSSSPGKLNRGLSVVDSFKLLKEGKDLTEEEIFLSRALGWCIEWVCKDSTFFFNLSVNYRYPPDSLCLSLCSL